MGVECCQAYEIDYMIQKRLSLRADKALNGLGQF